MKTDSPPTARAGSASFATNVLFAAALGVAALFVFFVAGSAFEVKGRNSIQEIVASCLVGGLYIGFCQFWVAPKQSRGLRAKWPTLLGMIGPAVLMVALIGIENPNAILVPGLPWLVSACLGSCAGAMIADRVAGAPRHEIPLAGGPDSLRSSRRYLLVGFANLVAVAFLVVVGVIPPLVADHTPGFSAGSVAIFLGATVAFELVAAAVLAVVALKSVASDRYSRGTLGLPVHFTLLLFLIYAFASGIGNQNPALRTAAVLLVLCAAANVATTALVTAASVVGDRALQANG